MDRILRRSNISPQEKLTRLAALQGRFEKIRRETGVLSSSSTAVAAAAPPSNTTAVDETNDNEDEDENEEGATKNDAGDREEEIIDPL